MFRPDAALPLHVPSNWMILLCEHIEGGRDTTHLEPPIHQGFNVRVWRVEVEIGWQDTMLHGQGHFCDACQPGCWFGVADVGLDRANQQRACIRPAPVAEHPCDGIQFLWVSSLGSSAMCFNITHITRVDIGFGVNFLKELPLELPIWVGHAWKERDMHVCVTCH